MVGCIKIKSIFKLCWTKLLLLSLIYPSMTSRTEEFDTLANLSLKKRNMIVNTLINKLIAYIRHIIKQGSSTVGIPILDPLEMEHFHLIIPTGLFNLDLRFKNISAIGFGEFVSHRNFLHLSNLTFELEIFLPRVIVTAETIYVKEIYNDFVSSIPILYNMEKTELEIDNFRLQANMQLKQSDDEKSILIDKIKEAVFDIPSFKIHSDGAVDSENFQIFSEFEDGVTDYVNICKDTIIKFISHAILTFGNPILNRLDTWRYIDVFL